MKDPQQTLPDVFDKGHYASTPLEKLKRTLQLGPKYYFWDLPRYLLHRRQLRLAPWDLRALVNPLREFRRRTHCPFPLPPGYADALQSLAQAGARLTMPRGRLEALLGAWWTTRQVSGHVIECGSYRGATALLVALLGKTNGLDQAVLMLDTFQGTPRTSGFDVGRKSGEFVPPEDQVGVIRRQAEALGVQDRIEIQRGLFADTFTGLEKRGLRFAFVHIDANLYQGTWEACAFTVPRTLPGGVVVFDDYNGACDLGARLAIDRYLAATGARPLPLAGSSVYLRIRA